jgi:Domain of unknown function (DUF4192)
MNDKQPAEEAATPYRPLRGHPAPSTPIPSRGVSQSAAEDRSPGGPAAGVALPGDGAAEPPPPGTLKVPRERPRVRVTSPADLLAVVPHLFGFHPASSFVVLGATGPRTEIELGFRYDLPDPPRKSSAAEIAEHAGAVLSHRQITTLIGVGYGPGRLVAPVADALTAVAKRQGLRLQELLRAENGRYWSYLCHDACCCPDQGVPFDYRSHLTSVVMTAAGFAAYPDRAARAQAIAPLSGDAAEAVERAIRRACDRAETIMAEAAEQGSRNPLRRVVDEGRRAVREAIRVYQSGERITDDDQMAWLLVALVNLPVRDDAWARMDPDGREAHLTLWADLTRRATGPWLPAPACLLAFTAWQSGDGTLANIALARALEADPTYSMALLLRDILDAGVPPSLARLPLTPEEVADGYEQAEQPSATSPSHQRQKRSKGRQSRGERGAGTSAVPAKRRRRQ